MIRAPRTFLPLMLAAFLCACGGQAAPPTAAPTQPSKPAAPAATGAPTTAPGPAPTSAAAAPNTSGAGVTQALIDAAKKEGTLVWYTAIELQQAELVAKKFEETYGIKVEVNRTGSERVLQRVMQEAEANVNAVDVINSADAGHYVLFKGKNMLAQYTPASLAKYPSSVSDKDGYYFAWRYILSTPAYNPRLIKSEEAPTTWKDLLDPKWKGKMVSAHPSYSGNIVNWVAVVTDLYTKDYLDALAKQDVMLVQSALDPVTKVASSERALAVNGSEYTFWNATKKGDPVQAIYPSDGIPYIPSPSGIAAKAPHPNAAKLFQEYIFDLEAQQMLVDQGQYSEHPDVTYPEGRKKLSDLKLVNVDENRLDREGEALKKAFSQAFGA